MSDTDALSIAQALIRCPSVTPEEGGALDYLQGLLEARGFTCHRLPFTDERAPRVDNLYARLGTDAPHLMFAGHTDVVPPGDETKWTHPPFAGSVADGEVWGRGAADMKGGIAAFIAALFAHLDAHGAPQGSVSLLITGDEEGVAVNGTAKVLAWAKENGETFDAALVGEPTNPDALGDMIKIGRRGSLSGTITITGTQGHAAYPHRADNPVPTLAAIIAAVEAETLDEGSDHFQPSNLEFTSVDVGNAAFNVIPGAATARFNIRYNDRWTAQKLEAWLKRHLEAHAPGSWRLDLEPAVSDVFLTGQGPLSDMLVAAVKDVTGRTPELSTAGGTSDARFIKDHCPVIEFGLVGSTMHQVDERVALADLEKLTQIYRGFLVRYFS